MANYEHLVVLKPEKEVIDLNHSKIFISHRSVDKEIADIIQDFFIALGVHRDMIFCSSLPGSDVKEKISAEIKEALKNSCLNIAILSQDYYQSAYCLNEAGILWFLDIPLIPIVMPEIDCTNMIGFLDDEYKTRKLDNDDDIAYINDCLCEIGILKSPKAIVLNQEIKKVISRYNSYIENRQETITVREEPNHYNPSTDDEAVVLYYCALHKIRKINKDSLIKWLYENEIYRVNIDNAFDLISASGDGTLENDTLTLDIDVFRKFAAYEEIDLTKYQTIVEHHVNHGDDSFQYCWDNNQFDDCLLLFISYIIDERMFNFGDRWMADHQISSIKQWESKYSLISLVSDNYETCLSFFIKNEWVYPCDYTSYGNPREYKLHNSVKQLLIANSSIFVSKLKEVKENYLEEGLPF